MGRILTRPEVEALAASIGGVLERLEGGELSASTGQQYRLQGALVALEAVLGKVSVDNME